jgi:hypothetical protein
MKEKHGLKARIETFEILVMAQFGRGSAVANGR